jgi:hypothetical protein
MTPGHSMITYLPRCGCPVLGILNKLHQKSESAAQNCLPEGITTLANMIHRLLETLSLPYLSKLAFTENNFSRDRGTSNCNKWIRLVPVQFFNNHLAVMIPTACMSMTVPLALINILTICQLAV